MKINRFIALTAIALLVVGAMGTMAFRSFALGTQTAAGTRAQTSLAQASACSQDQADGTEVTSSVDTDNVDLQCGDQSTLDTGTAAATETVGSVEAPASAESANEAQPSDGPNGPSVQVDQSGQNDGQFGQ
ncbi:MAG TPA: hypothetical protein VIN60_01085 [Anaerolineales bacterium]